MNSSRRSFICTSGMGLSCSGGKQSPEEATGAVPKKICRNRIGISTYSFWQFNGPKENVPIEDCIEKAAATGFDGIEFLLRQVL